MIGNFPAVLISNRLFLKLNRFICNWLPVLPGHSSPPFIFCYPPLFNFLTGGRWCVALGRQAFSPYLGLAFSAIGFWHLFNSILKTRQFLKQKGLVSLCMIASTFLFLQNPSSSSHLWKEFWPESLGHILYIYVRAALHYGGEVHWLVKNFSPRHGYLKRGMVLWRRWNDNKNILFKLEFSNGQFSCPKLWGCPRNFISREPPL